MGMIILAREWLLQNKGKLQIAIIVFIAVMYFINIIIAILLSVVGGGYLVYRLCKGLTRSKGNSS